MTRLDETDVKLLKALQKDAKVNTKELCDELNLSKTPVYERIRRLENDGVIYPFLASAYSLVDAAVDKYLKRGFSSLSVGFGCTGGRHRSVYSAHAMAEHLRARYPQVNVVEIHREQPHLKTDRQN